MIEFKTFTEDSEGFIVHVTVNGDDLNMVWSDYETVMGWMRDAGAKPNKGFENKVVRVGGGGGGKRPEDPIPDDLKPHTPVHCGEPMIYKASYESPNTHQKVGAKFECRKGADCERGRVVGDKKYGATIWEDAYRRELASDGTLVA